MRRWFPDDIHWRAPTARRLRVLDTLGTEATFLEAEFYALHVGKIVEGIASAAARVAEEGGGPSVDLGTREADKILANLQAKGMLVLPKAEDIGKSDQPGFAVMISGAPSRDLEVIELKEAYRASAEILRCPNPESMDPKQLGDVLANLRSCAGRLRGWLWNHAMFFQDDALIVQMGMLGTDSFYGKTP